MSTKYRNSADVPTAAIVARLNELSDAIAGGSETMSREFDMRVPPEHDRDADLVLAEAARRLEQVQARAEAVEFEDYDAGPLNDWGGGNVASTPSPSPPCRRDGATPLFGRNLKYTTRSQALCRCFIRLIGELPEAGMKYQIGYRPLSV